MSENVRCLLCGSDAERSPYLGARGYKYICQGRCPDYAVSPHLHSFLDLEYLFPADVRKKISDYLAALEPNPDEFYVLTAEDILSATGIAVP